MLVDAAHNPHGAKALASAVREYFDFDEIVTVLGVLEDKDAAGIIAELAPVTTLFVATQSASDRAIPSQELAELVQDAGAEVSEEESVETALREARDWAGRGPKRAVLVTGSITLVGEAIAIAAAEGWKE